MSTKGQTINDRFNAAKYTLAGQALARCICKATTEELMKPKKKHLDYLAACTYETNVSMQHLSNVLIERTKHSNWAVVYKALITVHHLMSYGSERFTQYLASSNCSFQLETFLDRIVAKGYAMSIFIRRYSNYLNQKALSYRSLAVDLCRKQQTEANIVRLMPIERLLAALPIMQKQLDVLLDFGCTSNDLNNSIITASYNLLFHDAIRLFANYNDGIINLLEKYFDLNKKHCREAFEQYKKFLACTDRMVELFKVAEEINLDRGEVPDFKRAPSSLLDALEQHVLCLEGNKKRERVVIDTRSAAFPSFSSNATFDIPQPELDNVESELSFVVDDGKIATNNPIGSLKDVSTPFSPPKASPQIGKLSNYDNTFDEQLTSVVTTDQRHEVAFDLGVNEAFDTRPPGYSGGSLLEPELTQQLHIDPSIDPHTQQQLLQIHREQVANKHRQQSNNASQPNSFSHSGGQNNYASTRSSKSSKPKHESIFEDLEKTMRQSLQKVENA